jgi:hypothetical protein
MSNSWEIVVRDGRGSAVIAAALLATMCGW